MIYEEAGTVKRIAFLLEFKKEVEEEIADIKKRYAGLSNPHHDWVPIMNAIAKYEGSVPNGPQSPNIPPQSDG